MPIGTEKTFDPVREFEGYFIDALHTGSRVICNPPPEDTDDDYLFLVDKALLDKFVGRLESLGFKVGGSGHYSASPPELEEYPDPAETENKGRFFRSYKKDFGDKIRKTELTGYDQYQMAGRNGDTARRRTLEKALLRGEDIPVVVIEEAIPDVSNVIVTLSPDYFENFRKATYLARYLNLQKKEERVTVFQAVCHDVWP